MNEKLEIIQLNDTAHSWLGRIETPGPWSLKDLPGEMGRACFLDASRVVANGEGVREHQVECFKADGTVRMISLNAAPILDTVEEFRGAVIVARDITLGLPDDERQKKIQFHGFIGSSNLMQEVYRLIENVGRVDTAVLVTGESGTGKELAAEALHNESRRKDRLLVKVDCAAMPEDLLESELFGHVKGAFTGADRDRPGRLLQADKGTLFLDEIGDISPRMQLRLLRFLQEKTFNPVGQDRFVKVDVRIIAATNVKLKEKVKEGKFREDLYYRLKVVEIILPPLRERKECIPMLVHHFLAKFGYEFGKKIINISDQAMEVLQNYRWPGNVRELRHVIERACVLCKGKTLLKEHFTDEIVLSPPGGKGIQMSTPHLDLHESKPTPMSQYEAFISEEDQITEALRATGGNRSRAAKLLGIDRSTLYRKMKKYKL